MSGTFTWCAYNVWYVDLFDVYDVQRGDVGNVRRRQSRLARNVPAPSEEPKGDWGRQRPALHRRRAVAEAGGLARLAVSAYAGLLLVRTQAFYPLKRRLRKPALW